MELKLETYVHPSLKKVVPVEIRKQVYRKAIKGEVDLMEYGLCLALPMILWNLDSYLGRPKNGDFWYYVDTCIAFPELTEQRIESIQIEWANIYRFRKQILIEMLNELENARKDK